MKRRDFLDLWLKFAGSALGVFVLYPIARYLVPPSIPEAVTRRVAAAKTSELKPGSFKTFAFGSQPGILIRSPDGSYRALSAVCTHLGCTVQYKNAERLIWCACHNGRYDLDGRNVSGPPPRPLERYVVHVEGEDVIVEKAKTA
jgi:Rieske Fe-S protein